MVLVFYSSKALNSDVISFFVLSNSELNAVILINIPPDIINMGVIQKIKFPMSLIVMTIPKINIIMANNIQIIKNINTNFSIFTVILISVSLLFSEKIPLMTGLKEFLPTIFYLISKFFSLIYPLYFLK
jgi:hypothetical protein